MIPCLAIVRWGGHRRRTIRLWLPLFLLWPLLLPFAVVLAIAGLIMARVGDVAASDVMRTGWQLISGWRGTRIEVNSPAGAYQIRVI